MMRRHRQKKNPATLRLNFVQSIHRRSKAVRIRTVHLPAVTESVATQRQDQTDLLHHHQDAAESSDPGDAGLFSDSEDKASTNSGMQCIHTLLI